MTEGVDRQDLATKFFAQWGDSYEALIKSFELLAEDGRWIQRPIPTLVGPVAARRFLAIASRIFGLATIDVEILGMAENDRAVYVERIDHLRRSDGSVIVPAPVTGVIEFRDGRIIRWREYFDALEFTTRATRSGVAFVAKRSARGIADWNSYSKRRSDFHLARRTSLEDYTVTR